MPPMLMRRGRDGRMVSRRWSELAGQRYAGSRFKLWKLCVRNAREELGFQNRFVPVDGKTRDGQMLHKVARALRRESEELGVSPELE